jgi:hypothetical protein
MSRAHEQREFDLLHHGFDLAGLGYFEQFPRSALPSEFVLLA